MKEYLTLIRKALHTENFGMSRLKGARMAISQEVWMLYQVNIITISIFIRYWVIVAKKVGVKHLLLLGIEIWTKSISIYLKHVKTKKKE